MKRRGFGDYLRRELLLIAIGLILAALATFVVYRGLLAGAERLTNQ
jgi:hypothetical protein